MKWILRLTVLCLLAQAVFSISHRASLIWTEKEESGSVKISGVAGDPEDWFLNGSVVLRGGSSPLDFFSRMLSYRVALAFRYSTRQLFFSDRGFKVISQMQLKVIDGDHYAYNASIETVFSGTSVLVYGMAVDWMSGSIYWTDANYNWITVGSTSRYGLYRHLVVTGLDLPMGIAVHPKKGLMYWSDWGVIPKIERSNLGGTDRTVLLSSGLRRPLGLTIDYDQDRLYWVDDETDTVEMSDLDGGHRDSFSATEPGHRRHALFGIAVYRDFIFVTDQLAQDVRAYRNSTREYVGRFVLDRSTPYDIMMYADSRQEEMDTAECKTKGCDHLCISTAGGHGQCMCSQDYELQADNKTCKKNLLFTPPQYIYSTGNSICRVKINSPDKSEASIAKYVQCFEKEVGHVRALGFHSYAQLLFYSDTDRHTICRKRMSEPDEETEVIAAQTGHVTGITVDWIAGHVYWTDELFGHIMVCDITGRYQRVLLRDLDKPRGIAVDPKAGFLYWCAGGAIYRAETDGSAAVPIVEHDITSPAGMSLDIKYSRLYWTDDGRIESISLTNLDDRILHLSVRDYTLNDVTIYQDYIAWTTTSNMLFFGYKKLQNPLRAVKHENSTGVYDIVAYDTYLQPLSEGPCDSENGGCSQLCFPKPKPLGRQCACELGFHLATDNKACVSEFNRRMSYFVLFVDPYRKQAYQLDVNDINGKVGGIVLESAAFPAKIEYDPDDATIYWFDPTANVISRESIDGTRKEVFYRLPSGGALGNMVLHSKSRQLLYTNAKSADIVAIDLDHKSSRIFYSGSFIAGSLAIDNENGLVFWAEKSTQHTCTIFHRSVNDSASNVTRAKESFVTSDHVKGLAIDPDGKYLIWWTSDHVTGTYLNDSASHVSAVIRSGETNYTSAVVVGNSLYYTTWTSRTILKVDLLSPSNVVALPMNFSRISDIRAYKVTRGPPSVTDNPKTPSTSTTGRPDIAVNPKTGRSTMKSESTLPMFGGIAGGLVALMLVAMVLVYVVMRRRRRKRSSPSPPTVMYTAPSHDNPTYMSRDEVQAQAVALAAAAGGATSACSPLPPSEKRPIEESSGGATDATRNYGRSPQDDATAARACPSIDSSPDIAKSVTGSDETEVKLAVGDTQTENDCAKLVLDTNDT